MVSMIRPIIPNITTVNTSEIACWVTLLFTVVIAAFLMAKIISGKFHGDKKKTVLCFIGISVSVALMCLCFFGFAATTFKGIIFCLVLLYASYADLKERECDDFVHVLILVAAFIGTEVSSLTGMFLSAIFVFTLVLVISLLNHSGIGGADIKLIGACTFLLGLSRGLAGLFFGLLLGVIVNLIKQKKYKDAKFPMIPYLAVGFMAAYFM